MESFENFEGLYSRVSTSYKIDTPIEKFVNNEGNSPVNCEHPSFVLNKSWQELWIKSGVINYVKDGLVCYLKYDDYKHLNSYQLVSYFYSTLLPLVDSRVMNEFNFGGYEPLFYLFPCGHCSLCRAYKSSEYAFRAACESYVYPNDILFVTLTYKDEFLPSDGVRLDHLQNFFKRLRFWLSKRGLPTNFRYLAVSEYGSLRGRPHYHIIIWNFPTSCFPDMLKAYSAIRYAWMTYWLDSDGKRQYVYSEKFKKYFPKRTTFGIAYILPMTEGCASYIVKYFRKESANKLHYPNDTFLCSSRRNGGIGYSYIRSLYDFVINNKAVSISVLDPSSQKEFKFPVSGYIRSILLPCRSSLYTRHRLYGNLVDALNYYHKAKACSVFLNGSVTPSFYESFITREFSDFFIKYPDSWYKKEYSYYARHDKDFLIAEYMKNLACMDRCFNEIPVETARKLNELCRVRREYIKFRQKNYSGRLYNIYSNVIFESYKYTDYLKKCKF